VPTAEPRLLRGTVVALFGPTGLGKTEIAVALAERIGGEIVSADSMQVYRGLPIVTNQPNAEQQRSVPHHLVGFVDPRRDFSVAEYARLAHAEIDAIHARDAVAILEGGSGLYLRAALGGLAFGVMPSPALRKELAVLGAGDPSELLRRLRVRDPATAEHIDPHNRRRVQRALETVLTQGHPLTEEQRDRLWTALGTRYEHRVFCLDVDRESLRVRVDRRVDRMVADGLLDEIRSAAEGGLSKTVRQAIGVNEMLDVIADETTLDTAIMRIKSRTRRYVRRQLTWMRKLTDAGIIPTLERTPDDVAADIGGRLS
jgi:tRNA dimethylallyltransferase